MVADGRIVALPGSDVFTMGQEMEGFDELLAVDEAAWPGWAEQGEAQLQAFLRAIRKAFDWYEERTAGRLNPAKSALTPYFPSASVCA